MDIIKKVGLAVFKDDKILMTRSANNDEAYYVLGGKIEPDETEIECLKRETKEEINCEIDEKTIQFLQEFTDVAHGRENTLVNIKLYTAGLLGTPEPSQEIAEVQYFDSKIPPKHLTIMGKQIFTWLKENNYIK